MLDFFSFLNDFDFFQMIPFKNALNVTQAFLDEFTDFFINSIKGLNKGTDFFINSIKGLNKGNFA